MIPPIEGAPLLLNFGPVFVKDASVWSVAKAGIEPQPGLFGLHHLWQAQATNKAKIKVVLFMLSPTSHPNPGKPVFKIFDFKSV